MTDIIRLYFCFHRGVEDPALWAGKIGNSWRTTNDINDTWARLNFWTLIYRLRIQHFIRDAYSLITSIQSFNKLSTIILVQVLFLK